jgi:hypothetical protein
VIDLNLEFGTDVHVDVPINSVPALKGCSLVVRRPSYAEVVKDVALAGEPWVKQRLSLVVGWKGKDGEPSPFVDPRDQRPIPFSERAFEVAVAKFPRLVDDALNAAAKVINDQPSGDELGK